MTDPAAREKPVDTEPDTRGARSGEAAPIGRRPVALIVLDGWGYAEPSPGNAPFVARTPVIDDLLLRYPWVLLEASGRAVGLPEGVMGNSEVGHLTLGSGRVIYQDLTRINNAVEDGSFYENEVLVNAIDAAVERGSSVHLMGLLSDGGVHSAIEHLHALVEMAGRQGAERVYVHAFMDGRDTSPYAGKGFLADLERFLDESGTGEIATIVGRYYAMDRDNRWERTKSAYEALVHGRGARAADAETAINASYDAGVTDEFVEAVLVGDADRSRIRDGDSVIFFNFRPDRTRQLTRAFIEPEFSEFDRDGAAPQVGFVGMTEYEASFDIPVAFPDEPPANTLAEVLSEAGLSQLHIAETEKYAHVTFFFNGGVEEPFPGEVRRLIPSPKDVQTYDQRPAMSAERVAEVFAEAFRERPIDFVVLNFANPDMVGHTGDLEATISAMETVDRCLEEVLAVLKEKDSHILVTADHGNSEFMLYEDGSPNTAHTTNPVRLVYLQEGCRLREGAGLSDIAPTVLRLLGVDVPPEMTGVDLCVGS